MTKLTPSQIEHSKHLQRIAEGIEAVRRERDVNNRQVLARLEQAVAWRVDACFVVRCDEEGVLSLEEVENDR